MIRRSNWPASTARRYLCAVALGAGAITMSAVRPAHAGLFSAMSEQDEIKAGQQVAAQSIKEYGGALPPDDPRSVRVRAIGMQLAALSSRKTIPYSYTVLNNDKVLNAFAAPGGPIFITKKLLDTTANDAELAYVLGHETTHIDHKHIVKMVEKQQKVGLLAGLAAALLGRGGNANAVNAIGSVALQAWQSGFSRKDENEADLGGIRFMSQLGYDPRAAITMLAKLPDGPDNPVSKLTADHPASSERQRTVQYEIDRDHLLDVARQHGGPRLTSNLNFGTGYTSYTPGQNAPAYYPTNQPAVAAGQNNLPDYSGGQYRQPAPATAQNGEINLGLPMRLANGGDAQVIMAPVRGIANWAGAQLRTRGNTVTVDRGNNSLQLNLGSAQAVSNGQQITMTAPAQVAGGELYAPIGTLAEGLGGHAQYDGQQNVVWLTLGNSRGFVRVP